MRRYIAQSLVFAVFVLILALTLYPFPETHESLPGVQPWRFSLADLLANVALFVPLGLTLAWSGRPRSRALLLAFATSCGIEIAQIGIPGRFPGLLDVLGNSAGAFLGFTIANGTERWLDPDAHQARRLLATTGIVISGLLMASGWLLVPSQITGPYFLHAPPQVDGLHRFGGTIDEVELNGEGLEMNRIRASDRLHAALAGDFELSVRAHSGGSPPAPSGLLMITGATERSPLLLLVRDGPDLIELHRGNTLRVGLEPVALRFPGVMTKLAAGDPLELIVRRSAGRSCIRLNGLEHCRREPTVGDTWSLFLPQLAQLTGTHPALAFSWIAVLGLPLGFWSRCEHLTIVVLVGVATVAIGVPALSPLRAAGAVELAGALVGYTLGHALARTARRANQSVESAR
jgi:VanZ family protein